MIDAHRMRLIVFVCLQPAGHLVPMQGGGTRMRIGSGRLTDARLGGDVEVRRRIWSGIRPGTGAVAVVSPGAGWAVGPGGRITGFALMDE